MYYWCMNTDEKLKQEDVQGLGAKTEQNLKQAMKEQEEVEHLVDLFIIALFLIFIIYTLL